MATMLDVSRLAGVSKATVSNVLNRRGNVSAAVQKRVFEACKRLSYSVNPNIQDLVRAGRNGGRRGVIGFVVIGSDIADPYTSRFMDGIARGANENNQHLSIATLTGRETSVYDLPPLLRDRRVDGILMTGQVGASIELIRSLDLPFVVLGNYAASQLRGAVSVEFDYEAGYGKLAEMLQAAGCRRIAYISKELEFFSERQEVEAFKNGLTGQGLEVYPELLVVGGGIFVDFMTPLSQALDRLELPFDALFTHDFKTADQFVHLWLGRNWGHPWPSNLVVATSRPYAYYRLPVPALYMNICSDVLAQTGFRVLMDILDGRTDAQGHRTLVHLDVIRDECQDERFKKVAERSSKSQHSAGLETKPTALHTTKEK